MSGSGGGGGGGPVRPDEITDCASLIERTVLNSPDPDVIKDLEVGDELSVTVNPANILQVATQEGHTAGSITSAQMLQFIDCIERGHDYVAIVQSISGGRCEVELRPESQ